MRRPVLTSVQMGFCQYRVLVYHLEDGLQHLQCRKSLPCALPELQQCLNLTGCAGEGQQDDVQSGVSEAR